MIADSFDEVKHSSCEGGVRSELRVFSKASAEELKEAEVFLSKPMLDFY